MRRIKLTLVACVSMLAMALSAAPAGAAVDPAPPMATAQNELENLGADRALAWDCDAGFSCYYTGTDGGGTRWRAPGCGFYSLGSPLKDNLYSIHNRGSGVVSLYNWTGHGYELKGWVYPEGHPSNPTGRGNFPVNVGADLVHINC
jgi:hypothetical protein